MCKFFHLELHQEMHFICQRFHYILIFVQVLFIRFREKNCLTWRDWELVKLKYDLKKKKWKIVVLKLNFFLLYKQITCISWIYSLNYLFLCYFQNLLCTNRMFLTAECFFFQSKKYEIWTKSLKICFPQSFIIKIILDGVGFYLTIFIFVWKGINLVQLQITIWMACR